MSLPFLLAACGGDDDSGSGSESAPGVAVDGPPLRYMPAVEEMPGLFTVDEGNSFGLSSRAFAGMGPFRNVQEGDELAEEWGYTVGNVMVFRPDGLLAGVLEGRYFATIMIHQFETPVGARDAFAHYKSWSDGVKDSETEDAPILGNESGAWSIATGTVANTEMKAIHHRVVIRRGNIVADVRTEGGEPFMSVDDAAALALIIDQRATGERLAEMPTPGATGTQ